MTAPRPVVAFHASTAIRTKLVQLLLENTSVDVGTVTAAADHHLDLLLYAASFTSSVAYSLWEHKLTHTVSSEPIPGLPLLIPMAGPALPAPAIYRSAVAEGVVDAIYGVFFHLLSGRIGALDDVIQNAYTGDVEAIICGAATTATGAYLYWFAKIQPPLPE